jgi:hypothetical protein
MEMGMHGEFEGNACGLDVYRWPLRGLRRGGVDLMLDFFPTNRVVEITNRELSPSAQLHSLLQRYHSLNIEDVQHINHHKS